MLVSNAIDGVKVCVFEKLGRSFAQDDWLVLLPVLIVTKVGVGS